MDEEEGAFEEYLGYENMNQNNSMRKILRARRLKSKLSNMVLKMKMCLSKPDQASIIEKLELEIDHLNEQIEKGEITFEKYNELLIFNQMKIADEKIKAFELAEKEKISAGLMSELDTLSAELKKRQKQSKFDPTIVGGTVDDIFRKYGEALEKGTDRGKGIFL